LFCQEPRSEILPKFQISFSSAIPGNPWFGEGPARVVRQRRAQGRSPQGSMFKNELNDAASGDATATDSALRYPVFARNPHWTGAALSNARGRISSPVNLAAAADITQRPFILESAQRPYFTLSRDRSMIMRADR
jgi:hypothetical protein